MKEIISTYISEQFLVDFSTNEVTDETNLFEAGYVDSLGFIELVSFLEKKFAIRFTADELSSKQFTSLRGIINLLDEKIHAHETMSSVHID